MTNFAAEDLIVEVQPDTLDYNGHMNVGHYLHHFEREARHFFGRIDLSEAYSSRTDCALFVREAHLTFEREARANERLRLSTHLLGATAKVLHCLHRMTEARSGLVIALDECLYVHVDRRTRRSTELPPDKQIAIQMQVAWDAGVYPRPAKTAISLRSPKQGKESHDG